MVKLIQNMFKWLSWKNVIFHLLFINVTWFFPRKSHDPWMKLNFTGISSEAHLISTYGVNQGTWPKVLFETYNTQEVKLTNEAECAWMTYAYFIIEKYIMSLEWVYLWTHMCTYGYSMSSNVVLPTHVVVGWVQVNYMVFFDMLDVTEN